ncbi:MAG TPA: hypothetical protein VJ964_02040 [Balneolaceae bacterium]|nr:hypothetical protein [Balneolaceae bacterium]
MNKHNHHDEWYLHSESPNIKDSIYNSRVSHFVDRTHTLNTLYLVAGFCQILLGMAVITISVLGLIKPFWLSASLSMISSVTTMIGLYLVYITVSNTYDRNSLLRNAMKRVMESKN